MSQCRSFVRKNALMRLLAVASVVATLVACAETPDLNLDTIELSASDRANDNSPVAVDLVMVHEEPLVEQILALTAQEWFDQRDQLRVDHPRGLTVFSWEVVPGQTLTAPVRGEQAAWAGIVFTKYQTPGPHRLRVDPPRASAAEQVVRLRLEEGKAVAVPVSDTNNSGV